MAKPESYLMVAVKAEEVLREHGIQSLPVDVKALALKLGFLVEPKECPDGGVSGMLIRLGNHFGIAYATHIESNGFQRFSIAHELGHYFLAGHVEAVLEKTDSHASRAGFSSGDRYEMEADHFAAGLLMPKSLFVPALKKAGSGLSAVEKLSKLCETSMPATAIRYAQCSNDPVAIIISTGSTVDYCFMSESLKGLKGIRWLQKGQEVPRGTPTRELNSHAEKVMSCSKIESTSNLSDWFNCEQEIEICESVIGLGNYGKTLTVLFDIELPDEDEEADSEYERQRGSYRF